MKRSKAVVAALSLLVLSVVLSGCFGLLSGPKKGVVEGIVVSETDEPIAGAKVTLGSVGTEVTPESGEFAFKDVKHGPYTLTVHVDEQLVHESKLTVSDKPVVKKVVVKDENPVQTGTVTGVVTDQDANAIAGATVSVGERQDVTDEDGTYTISDLAIGTHHVSVEIDGAIVFEDEVTVAEETVDYDITVILVIEPEVLFKDDFSGDLSNWTLSTDQDRDPSEYFSIVDGNMVFAPVWFGNAYAGDDTWTDYAVEVQLEVLEYGAYSSTRLFVRSDQVWEGYSATLSPETVVLHRFEGNWDIVTILGDANGVHTPVDELVTVRVEVQGNSISVYHNDVLVIEADDLDNVFATGGIVLRADNTSIRVHEVTVTQL